MNRQFKNLLKLILAMLIIASVFENSANAFAAGTDKTKKPENATEQYILNIEDAVFEGSCKLEKDGDKSYLTGLTSESDSIVLKVNVKDAYYFDAKIMASGVGGEQTGYITIDGNQMGGFTSKTTDEPSECIMRYLYLSEGEHDIKITRYSGDMKIYSFELNMRAEAYDITKTVPAISVGAMGLLIILLLVVIILFYVWIRHAYPDGKSGIFAGMASYFIICSCFLGTLYMGENYISAQITSVPIQHVLQIGYIMFECAVLVICLYFAFTKIFFQPHSFNYGNILMFSLGFALVESLKYVVDMAGRWLYATTINGMGLGPFIRTLESEEEIDKFINGISPLLDLGPVFYILLFIERLLFIAFVVAVISMMYTVFSGVKKTNFLVRVWAVYVLYYFPTILREFGVINGDVILFLIISICIITIIYIAYRVFSKSMPAEWNKYREIQKKGIYLVIFGHNDARKNSKGSIAKNANRVSKE